MHRLAPEPPDHSSDTSSRRAAFAFAQSEIEGERHDDDESADSSEQQHGQAPSTRNRVMSSTTATPALGKAPGTTARTTNSLSVVLVRCRAGRTSAGTNATALTHVA